MADGGSTLGPALGATGAICGPGDPRRNPSPSVNLSTNGMAVYDYNCLSITSDGYVFTATPGQVPPETTPPGAPTQTPNFSGTNGRGQAISIKTGFMMTEYANSQGGAPGWPNIKGFMWNPQGQSCKTCFEWVVTTPPLGAASKTWGMDVALWFSDPTGQVEFDLPEMDGVGGVNSGMDYAVINHVTGASHEFDVFGTSGLNQALTSMFAGGTHRYTSVVDSVAKTIEAWVDGVHMFGGPAAWPAGTLSTNPMAMLMIFDWRSEIPSGGVGPLFTTPLTMTIRSIACYQDTPHVGQGVWTAGGGGNIGTPWSAPLIPTGTVTA